MALVEGALIECELRDGIRSGVHQSEQYIGHWQLSGELLSRWTDISVNDEFLDITSQEQV